jgi:hypothetical protein
VKQGKAGAQCTSGTRNMQKMENMCMDSFRFCLSDDVDAAFFNAIEVNYPMYMSPIMLVPEHRHIKELQVCS